MPRYSVRARLLKSKSSTFNHVQVVYRHDGKEARISVGVSVKPAHWDNDKRQIRPVKGHHDHANDNVAIANVIAEVNDIARRREAQGLDLTPAAVKAAYDESQRPQEPEEADHAHTDEVAAYWTRYVRNKAKAGKYRPSTVSDHLQARDHVLAHDPVVTWEKINADWLDGFATYAREQGHTANTHAKHIKSLKAVMRAAWDAEKHVNDNFRRSYFRASFEVAADEIALTSEELTQLATVQLDSDKLRNARDLFLLNVWTGASHIDASQLNPSNLVTDATGRLYIDYTRTKSGVDAMIPVHPNVAHIATTDAQTWPRAISNQKLNRYIKDVARAAGIAEERAAKVVTTSGRRTFVTYMLSRGISPELVRGMTGHKTEKAFAGYSRFGAKAKAEQVANLPEFQ